MFHLSRVNGEARSFGSCLAFFFGGMEGRSSNTDNGRFSPDGDGEHNVDNFILCSFASCVQSALARILTRRRAGVRWLCRASSSVRTERWSVSRVFLVHCCSVLDASPIKEGLRQNGAGRVGRQSTGVVTIPQPSRLRTGVSGSLPFFFIMFHFFLIVSFFFLPFFIFLFLFLFIF